MQSIYSAPEVEVLTCTLEECILSQGVNERPDPDPEFPGGDED